MKTFSVQLYVNRITDDLTPYLTYVYQYFLKHNITLHFDIATVDVRGYSSAYGSIAAGGNGYFLQGADSLVKIDSSHDFYMFLFDMNEWKAPWYWPYPLAINAPRSSCVLSNGKPFINLGFYSKDMNGTEITMIHEPMHALTKLANIAGFSVLDQMDTYYLNSTPDAPNGNFAIQFNLLAQFLNPMQNAILHRTQKDSKETLGTLIVTNNGKTVTVNSLELSWLNNAINISCIPPGTYLCKWTPFYATYHYELQNVPSRTGIFIHNGNYYKDSLGCIILGVQPSDINGDGELDVTSSVATLSTFENFMGHKDFMITVI